MIEFRFNKREFESALRKYNEEGGHSYDQYDLAVAWSAYCKNPSEYDWLPSVDQ